MPVQTMEEFTALPVGSAVRVGAIDYQRHSEGWWSLVGSDVPTVRDRYFEGYVRDGKVSELSDLPPEVGSLYHGRNYWNLIVAQDGDQWLAARFLRATWEFQEFHLYSSQQIRDLPQERPPQARGLLDMCLKFKDADDKVAEAERRATFAEQARRTLAEQIVSARTAFQFILADPIPDMDAHRPLAIGDRVRVSNPALTASRGLVVAAAYGQEGVLTRMSNQGSWRVRFENVPGVTEQWVGPAYLTRV